MWFHRWPGFTTLAVKARLMKQILLLIGVTVLLSAIAVAVLLHDHPQPMQLRHQLGFELGKLLIQFVLTVILGGIVIQMYNRRTALRSSEDEQRRSFLKRLTEAMVATGRCRNSLCANAGGRCPQDAVSADGRTLAWNVYDQQMQVVSDALLGTKLLYDELRSDRKLFGAVKSLLLPELEVIIDYLDRLKDEYRDDAIDSVNDARELRVGQLPRLSLFARSSANGSNFYLSCDARFESAINIIKAHYFAPAGSSA